MKTTTITEQIYKIEMGQYTFYIDNTGDYSMIEVFDSKTGKFLNFISSNYELLEIEEIQEILEKNKNVNFEFMI